MKRMAGLFLAIWVSVLVPLAAQDVSRPPEARFEVDTTILDLGEVVRGEVVVAEFTIGNSGEAVLEIIDAVPG